MVRSWLRGSNPWKNISWRQRSHCYKNTYQGDTSHHAVNLGWFAWLVWIGDPSHCCSTVSCDFPMHGSAVSFLDLLQHPMGLAQAHTNYIGLANFCSSIPWCHIFHTIIHAHILLPMRYLFTSPWTIPVEACCCVSSNRIFSYVSMTTIALHGLYGNISPLFRLFANISICLWIKMFCMYSCNWIDMTIWITRHHNMQLVPFT